MVRDKRSVDMLFKAKAPATCFVNNGMFASNAAFMAELARERQDDVDDYKVYPIQQVAAGWRF